MCCLQASVKLIVEGETKMGRCTAKQVLYSCMWIAWYRNTCSKYKQEIPVMWISRQASHRMAYKASDKDFLLTVVSQWIKDKGHEINWFKRAQPHTTPRFQYTMMFQKMKLEIFYPIFVWIFCSMNTHYFILNWKAKKISQERVWKHTSAQHLGNMAV